MDSNNQPPRSSIGIPGAIIIAAVLIAGAILWNKPAKVVNNGPVAQQENVLKPVTSEDHILGNPNAKVFVVEYSDPSCPFCKMFHATMRKIMDEYGKTGSVAWVYRHFPLDKENSEGFILHPNAGKEAQAMECAAELGGNDGFWKFVNRLYEVTPAVTSKTPEGLDTAELPRIAQYAGLDVTKFNACLSSGKYQDKVEQDYTDGLNAGVAGTPFSFVVTSSGSKPVPINGAEPYSKVKAAIDALLREEE